MRRRSAPAAGIGAALAGSLLLLLLLAPTAGAAGTAPAPSDWTVYAGSPAGGGVSSVTGPVDTSAPAWTSPPLDGQLYGEPLAFDGRVYVATENDTVEAIDAANGRILWSAHLATPVPASMLPCGNIQPQVGITGTPVIDPGRHEIFAVTDELVRGTPAHVLVGLDTTTGAVELSQFVDPPGSDPAALLQRSGLNLDAGRVVFGLGGNYGDCGSYHGWVVAVGESGGAALRFEVAAGPGQHLGAIWMGGAAPVVDPNGNVWATAGNGSVVSSAGPYDDSDSVLELSPALQLQQFFAPTRWAADNAADLDLSTAPVLLADGQVVVAGKSQDSYLLDGAHLGGIGGQTATLATGCGDDVDGGAAVAGNTVYLPCLRGPIGVQVGSSPSSLREVWRSSVGGGPPTLAAGRLWTIGQDGVLYGLDPATGAVRQQAAIGAVANHFPAPAVGDGFLLAPAADRVVAFTDGTTVTVPVTAGSTATTTRPKAPAGTQVIAVSRSGGGLPAGALAGIAAAGAALVAGLAWFLSRRGTPSG